MLARVAQSHKEIHWPKVPDNLNASPKKNLKISGPNKIMGVKIISPIINKAIVYLKKKALGLEPSLIISLTSL